MATGSEPADGDAVQAFVHSAHLALDPFADVYRASAEHREGHRCDVYCTGSGRLLGLLAQSLGVRRALEVGCGLGYSALWLAWGSAPEGRIETVEADPEHARLAEGHFRAHRLVERIHIHVGRALDILPDLVPPFDLIFLDADWSEYSAYLDECLRLLRPGGLLVSSNLWPATYAPGLGGLAEVADYRRRLLEQPRLLSVLIPRGPGLSLMVAD
ncbi:MAG: class I SAM-dependent methyltransferase [Chloroflexi bacterium]|nr:class I SAM-dependent methyltransferase [Chloroflexota bacterium]